MKPNSLIILKIVFDDRSPRVLGVDLVGMVDRSLLGSLKNQTDF